MTTPSPTLAPFVRQQTVLLTSYRRDGTPVGTPVNIAVDGDRAFVRTWDTAGKWKRMRHTPEVTVGPATWRGTPTGPAIRARVRPLSGEESAAAGRAIAHKHPILQGVLVPLAHRLRGNRTMHVELTPLESAPVTASAAIAQRAPGAV
jgi:PPOX class probable F420-dependent enzyme